MAFTIFELLKEFTLSLVIEIGILGVFNILQPNGWINNLWLHLNSSRHALINWKLLHILSLIHTNRCGWHFLLRLLHLKFEGGIVAHLAELRPLCIVHRVESSLDYVVVLYANDLVDAVAQTSHLLAALVQRVLRHAIFDDWIVEEFPLIFCSHWLNNF